MGGIEHCSIYVDDPVDPHGNDRLFPKHPDGSRDLDTEWPHWKTWQGMEKLLKTGKARAIGVSNYSKQFLEELLSHCSVAPAVNQIENRKYSFRLAVECKVAKYV